MKYLALFLLCLIGCSTVSAENTHTTRAALTDDALTDPIVIDRIDAAYATHGVGGDGVLVFQVQPTAAATTPKGVHVLLPFLGHIAEVTPPPAGWGTPLTIKIVSSSRHGDVIEGQFLLLDNQVPPGLAGTQPSILYRYQYSFSQQAGFSSTLLETHTLPLFTAFPLGSAPPNGLFYAGSIALLPDGVAAITDNITGALWFSDASLDNWFLALIDPTPPPNNKFAGAFGPQVSGVGRTQGGGFHSYEFLTPAPPGSPPGFGLYPGSHSITYAALTDEVCWAVTLPGGIYCIQRADLLAPVDPTTKPYRNLVPGGFNSIGSYSDACDYDRFHPTSEWVYWQPAIAGSIVGFVNTMFRVSLVSGEIQTVAQSNDAFDFANEISVVPTPGQSKLTALISSIGQEYNNADVNVLLNGVSTFVSPSLVPLTVVRQ